MTLNLAFFLLIAYWLGLGSAVLVSEERSDGFATLIVGAVFVVSLGVVALLIVRGLGRLP